MEKMSLSDLAWKLTPIYQKKIDQRKPGDLLKQDRFTSSSNVSQKLFADLERVFFEHFANIEFIEMSPLQPIGINKILADINGKRVISTIRGQEVNADATTSLFLEAYKRACPEIRLATHVRTFRTKNFDPKTKFLSHFKVFSEISLGENGINAPYGIDEVTALIRHLHDEISVLNLLKMRIPNTINHFSIYISNMCLIRELVKASRSHNGDDLNIVETGIKLLKDSELPALIPLNHDLINTLRSLGFKTGLHIQQIFLDAIESIDWGGVELVFDPLRSAGASYYRHIAYRITATDTNGLVLPLADGGSTDWTKKMNGNKRSYVIASGIGTELLAQNFLAPTY